MNLSPSEEKDQEREMLRRLRLTRTKANITQEQAGFALGVLRPSYTLIEQGRQRLTATQLVRFAAYFNVALSWLTAEYRFHPSAPTTPPSWWTDDPANQSVQRRSV